MNIFKRFHLATLFLFCISHSYSQEAGRSFIRNYPPPEYRASQQNWAVTQDSRGIKYFGNNDGLLEDNFSSHEIDILIGDTFYLFSDGFPDQYGGPDHKKFSYRKFREKLIETGTVNMPDQKILLESILSDWTGNNSQTDDILVIGFRI
jgi:hypothetical protein